MGRTSPSQKYAAISSRIAEGITILYPSDVQFYLNYCNKNKITPIPVTEDPNATPVRENVNRVRYTDIMDRLNKGRSIDAVDYQFLKRYCRRMGMELPVVESRMQFWLKKED